LSGAGGRGKKNPKPKKPTGYKPISSLFKSGKVKKR